MRSRALLLVPALVAIASAPAHADPGEPTPGYHPWQPKPGRVRTIDVSPEGRASHDYVMDMTVVQPDVHGLDRFKTDAEPEGPAPADPFYSGARPARSGAMPEGWVQRGQVVLPAEIASGDAVVDPDAIWAIEDLPGNEYPRKHTLYLNFSGGQLNSGQDNSAEDKSILAQQGIYPTFSGGEQDAISVAQAVENDVAPYGIRVMYLERPGKIAPYTMEMIGGGWMDTNIEQAACGVAPGADCGALGQRHVVYAFQCGGGVTTLANTASQEAGHAWGLDHTFNCNSVMSYCGFGDGGFSSSCDALCEDGCQGENTAGCRLTHEEFCGVGNDQQNEDQELTWLFGGNEPDVEPPTAEIVSPEDGAVLEVGSSVDLRAVIGDNYGGYGWKWTIQRDDEIIFDEVAYERDVDDTYRPAVNLSGLDEGVWTMTITVQDQFNDPVSATVTVLVGDVEPPMATGDGSTGAPGETGDTASEESGGTAIDGMSDDGPDEDGGKDSCACRAGSSASTGWLVLVPLLAASAHRRRRRNHRFS